MTIYIYYINSFRKRSRETAEENEEAVPLTKRINNLHLVDSNSLETFYSNELVKHISNTNGVAQPSAIYNPELGEMENPYYHNNKLLYEMHICRLQRIQRQNQM